MAIADKLTKLSTDISNAYDAVDDKGGTVPAHKNTENLQSAINSIPTGSTPVIQPLSITENGTYTTSSGVDGYAPITVNVGVDNVPNLKNAPKLADKISWYWLIDNDIPNIPHRIENLKISTVNDVTTIEKGMLDSNNNFVVESTQTQAGDEVTLDWSNDTNRWVMYRISNAGGLGGNTNVNASTAYTPIVGIRSYNAVSTGANSMSLFGKLFASKFLKYIYIEGENMAFPQNKSFKPYLAKVIDLSEYTSAGSSVQPLYFTFANFSELEEIKFPSFETKMPNNYPRIQGCFDYCTKLKSVDLSMWDFQSGIAVTNWSNIFRNCFSLETINMSEANLSTVVTDANAAAFANCISLKNLILTDAILPALSLSFSDSPLLTNTSLVSLANALPSTSSALTLTLHSTPKDRLSNIMGDIVGGKFVEGENGNITLLYYINNTKGWTVA